MLTHYPLDLETAARITAQEAWVERDGPEVRVPDSAHRLVERLSMVARESDLVDPSSGVSARAAIAGLELLHSNLERRGLATCDAPVYPRLVDFHMVLPALTGKIELVYEGEQKGVEVVGRQLLGQAAKESFLDDFPAVGREVGSGGEDDDGPYTPIVAWFGEGHEVTLSDATPFAEHLATLRSIPGLWPLVEDREETDEECAFLAELVLEGLHQHLKLAREDLDSTVTFKEMVKFQLLRPQRAGD